MSTSETESSKSRQSTRDIIKESIESLDKNGEIKSNGKIKVLNICVECAKKYMFFLNLLRNAIPMQPETYRNSNYYRSRGSSRMDRYEKLSRLGEGSYGVVYKCRDRETNQLVAVKRFVESEDDPAIRKIALREVRMLKNLKHQNLVCLLEVFRRKRRLHLVFEFCEHTVLHELERHPQGVPDNLTKQIVYQTLLGVAYIHRQGVVHRDIKPENILLTETYRSSNYYRSRGSSRMDRYEKLSRLGEGSYGVVYKCRDRETNQLVAVKRFVESEDDPAIRKIALREVRMLKNLKHQNLVCLLEVFRRKRRLHLVFEFCEHTVLHELERHPQGVPDNLTKQIVYQTLLGVARTLGDLLPRHLAIFSQNDFFKGIQLPVPPTLEPLETKMPNRALSNPLMMDFLKKCLHVDPVKRHTCDRLLQHTYFEDYIAKQKEIEADIYAENRREKSKLSALTSLPQLPATMESKMPVNNKNNNYSRSDHHLPTI
uniref:cyclin-dependent kinase n=1 Tax=Culicoides sonorensis TaxID=179676 RepID=A0A336MPF9_CULSO